MAADDYILLCLGSFSHDYVNSWERSRDGPLGHISCVGISSLMSICRSMVVISCTMNETNERFNWRNQMHASARKFTLFVHPIATKHGH